jgi:hypothetical protein
MGGGAALQLVPLLGQAALQLVPLLAREVRMGLWWSEVNTMCVCGDGGREVICLHTDPENRGTGAYLLLTPYTHGVPHVDCEGPCAVGKMLVKKLLATMWAPLSAARTAPVVCSLPLDSLLWLWSM